MKKNGFTLVELLGVIIILALLVILVFPSIVNSVKNSSEKTDNLTLELIYNAADLYISNHKNDFPKVKDNKYIIDLKDLVDEGFLASPIKLSDSDTDITDNKCIQVNYDNEYKYSLENSETCNEYRKTICVAKTEATTGVVASSRLDYSTDKYKPGDEYTCYVNDEYSYTFFILSESKEEVNLIMYSNITDEGIPVDNISISDKGKIDLVSDEDYGKIKNEECPSGLCATIKVGPVTAMDYLNRATQNWTNIPVIKTNYIDDNYNMVFEDNKIKLKTKTNETTREYENLRVRLPYLTEIQGTGCAEKDPDAHWQTPILKCPLWMIDYTSISDAIKEYYPDKTGTDISGYWSGTSVVYDTPQAKPSIYTVVSHGGISSEGVNFGYDMNTGEITTEYLNIGVRPVITVLKTYLK